MSIIRKEQLSNPLSASYALTASYVENANFNTSSFVTTSSFNAFTSSYNTGSFSGSFVGNTNGTASWANNVISASYALTASYIENLPTFNTSSLVTTSSFNTYTASINNFTSSINTFTASYNTGSFTGSFIGNLLGTSSWAESASVSISSSLSISSSYSLSSSFALSASWAPTQNIDTSSFVTTSSFNSFTSSYNTGSFTGSFIGTSSWANNTITASFAVSTSYAETASFLPLGTYQITSSWALSASQADTASFINSTFISASAAASGFGSGGSNNLLTITVVTGSTSRVDDWNPTGYTTTTSVISTFVSNSLNALVIGGLSSGSIGRLLTIKNESSSSLIILENESSSSLSINRFLMDQRSALFMMPQTFYTFLFDGTGWRQFNQTPNLGGLQYFEEYLSPNPTSTTAIQTNVFWFVPNAGTINQTDYTGTGTQNEFGSIDLGTGASTSSTPRGVLMGGAGGGSYFNNVSGSVFNRSVLYVNKLIVPTLPSAAQDFFILSGLYSATPTSATGTAFGGWMTINGGYAWRVSGSGASTLFQTVTLDDTRTIYSSLDSSLPLSAATSSFVNLGIFLTGENGDAVFFYSTNGSDYVINNKFTRTSSTYSGNPAILIRKLAGSTARNMRIDWSGLSIQSKR